MLLIIIGIIIFIVFIFIGRENCQPMWFLVSLFGLFISLSTFKEILTYSPDSFANIKNDIEISINYEMAESGYISLETNKEILEYNKKLEYCRSMYNNFLLSFPNRNFDNSFDITDYKTIHDVEKDEENNENRSLE